MDCLQPPDSMYLSAAQGWLELGNSAEAAAELDRIALSVSDHPEVLLVRWQLAVKGRRWLEALGVSETLCLVAPCAAVSWIHRSYCLHELKRTQEAWNTLFPLVESFPDEWLIRYNLACYACQLGRIEEAKTWLQRAIELGDPTSVNRLAAADPDLRCLFQPST